MTFWNCVQDAWDELDQERLERMRAWRDYAQQVWKDQSDLYERQGHPRHMAEALAAEDAKTAFKKAAGEERHAFLARAANNRKQALEVSQASDLPRDMTWAVDKLDYRSRALVKRFNGKVMQYLDQHHRDMFQQITDPVMQDKVVREMLGESTGDPGAAALAQGLAQALDDMRLQANELGATIGKLDNYFPQAHNRVALMEAALDDVAKELGVPRAVAKARSIGSRAARDDMFRRSFDKWFNDISERIDWTRIEDRLTGRPFQPEGGDPPSIEIQRRFLRDVYDSIVYGPQAKDPTYGGGTGEALYRRMGRERVLHFKSADDWMAYNKKYGTSDPHHTLMAHVHGMARDIAAMREFGPNPQLGLDYRGKLAMAEARKRNLEPRTVEGGVAHANRMLRVQQGGAQASGYWHALSANFFSDTRHVLTSAFLDRAVLASISDLNFSKMAAQMIGADRTAAFSRYIDGVGNMVKDGSLTTDEMKQFMWISDTIADPGAATARFNGEAAGSSWAEKLSSGVMRISGLSSHTDQGKFALQQVFSAQMANQIGKSFDDIEPGMLTIFKEHGITAEDWAKFSADGVYEAGNGARFLNPLYWREATSLDPREADDLFFKFQGATEDFIEIGVPTQSLFMRGYFDPAGRNLEPGSAAYEIMKSSMMFKSFVMAMSWNMFRAMRRMPGNSKWAWAAESVAGATMMGAVSLQLVELSKGNDPMSMDDPGFWGQAALKGGGFAIVGDLIATGETRWGGGFASYMAGPIPQTAQDAWNLTFGNMIEVGRAVLAGEEVDANLPAELHRTIKRYTPGGDLPMFGPAFQRLVADQLYMMIDPEADDALLKSASRRENLYGNSSWWMPGSALPDRAPAFAQ